MPVSGKKRKTKRIRVPRPKACPCCGEARSFGVVDNTFYGLRVGVESASVVGVICHSCGLRMLRGIPNRWPRGVFLSGRTFSVNQERLQRWTMVSAVHAWNERV